MLNKLRPHIIRITLFLFSIAIIHSGCSSGGGGGSNGAASGNDITPPTVPTLTATAFSSTRIDLTWTASTDNVGVVGYIVSRGTATITAVDNITFSYSDTGLTASTLYTYSVIAVDGAGNASAAGTADATTYSASASPTTLAWDRPLTYTDGTELLESDLKEYRVYFSTVSGSYPTGTYYPVPAPATEVTVTTVISQGTGTYYFKVTAVDKNDSESDYSNEVSKGL